MFYSVKSVILLSVLVSGTICAQDDQFKAGTAIVGYGRIAAVEGMQPLPQNAAFNISFDIAKAAKTGEVNRAIDSLARFINMHVANGVAVERIKLAAVIHGSAVKDFTKHSKSHDSSVNEDLIKQLQSHGVEFYICGQSAAYHGVKTNDLLSGVKMSLSAMTAHALLQQNGYSLNPF